MFVGLGLVSYQKKPDTLQAGSRSSSSVSSPSVQISRPYIDSQIYSLSGPTMGTSYNIKLVLPSSRAKQLENLSLKVETVLAEVNEQMSTYQNTSELSLYNSSAPGDWIVVSDGLFTVISAAQSLSVASQGGFDITVGPLVNLWGFGPTHHLDKVPSESELVEAFARTGYEKLSLDNKKKALKKDSDLYLDLSSIAKGYGVDKVLELLASNNIESALVEVGGEIRAMGVKPNGGAWKIAIESPFSNTRAIQKVINIGDMALATSGDYRNYFEKEGVRYSHTINPKTGKPITHKLASVTVLHKSCMMADGLATMFMVMGPESALQYANENKLAIFMLVKSESGFIELSSQPFAQLFGSE